MKRACSMFRSIFLAAILLTSVLWFGRPLPVALAMPVKGPVADGTCLPAPRLPVTVLARGSAGQPFVPVTEDGADPFIVARTSRTLVPLRALYSALAPGTDSVRWDEANRTATAWFQGHTLTIHFPANTSITFGATVDGRFYSVTSYLCDDHVWVTARELTNALHLDIEYYEDGVVVIDAVGGSQADAGTRQYASACGSAPESILNYVGSPFAAPRQAAMAVACQLKQG